MMENPRVIPDTNGVPSKYCIKFVLANRIYLAHSYFIAISAVTFPPISNKKIDIPMANELFLNTAEIMKAIVVNMITSNEESKYVFKIQDHILLDDMTI